MGLFSKKYCDVCGEKIGLIGNRKLEDGNLCKDCAKKLSPWFSERRHSTLAAIREQLAYREDNKNAVAAFHTTRSLGRSTKLLIDEDARKFMVTGASNLAEANPDVLDYAQVTGCDLDIQENRTEKKQTVDGKSVSFNPPRYEYSYNFYCTIQVNHPYFDDMRFALNTLPVKTGERSMGGSGNWKMSSAMVGFRQSQGIADYYECIELGNQIKEAVDGMRQEIRAEVQAAAAPKKPVLCPFCSAKTLPDANGRCEYCGSPLG